MARRFVQYAAAIAVALMLTPALPARSQTSAPPAAGPDSAALKPMPLTGAQLKGFFDAMDELSKLGQVEAAKGGGKPLPPEAFARSLKLSGQSTAILEKNGFKDAADFQRVAYNAALAYSVLQQGGKEAVAAKQAEAKAQQAQALEQMRKHLSPEQVQALAGHMQSAMAIADAMQDVPPENVALIKPYVARMKALGVR